VLHYSVVSASPVFVERSTTLYIGFEVTLSHEVARP